MTQISPELAGKRLELLKETVPGMSRVAILWQPLHPNTPFTFRETKAACEQLGLQPLSLEVTEPGDFDRAFAMVTKAGAEGLVVLRDPFMVRHRATIAEFARESRLPAIYETSDFVKAGGLMMYGPAFPQLYRRSARFVDKILRGANPAELPVEQPTEFELVINMKTAKAIGLKFPPSVLVRADKVIE